MSDQNKSVKQEVFDLAIESVQRNMHDPAVVAAMFGAIAAAFGKAGDKRKTPVSSADRPFCLSAHCHWHLLLPWSVTELAIIVVVCVCVCVCAAAGYCCVCCVEERGGRSKSETPSTRRRLTAALTVRQQPGRVVTSRRALAKRKK